MNEINIFMYVLWILIIIQFMTKINKNNNNKCALQMLKAAKFRENSSIKLIFYAIEIFT